jgi:hypothetical protein
LEAFEEPGTSFGLCQKHGRDARVTALSKPDLQFAIENPQFAGVAIVPPPRAPSQPSCRIAAIANRMTHDEVSG